MNVLIDEVQAALDARPDECGLGSVNGYVASPAEINGQRVIFDGTPLGLARVALECGAQVDDVISADYGLGWSEYVITPKGGGTRTPGGAWVRKLT